MEGKVDILKPMSKIHIISGYEYFLQLMNYRKNDRYLYSLCIQENKRNFEIQKKDAELIPYIYLIYKLDEIKNRYFVDFKSVLDIIGITPEELDLDPDKIHSNGYIFNKSKQIKLKIPLITQNELIMYKFLDEKTEKREVILYQYEPFLRFEKNRFFGDAAFTGKGVRNGTARIVEDCYFGYWDLHLYNLNFFHYKKALFERKVNFLYNNFFFGKINIKKFETHFFNWFLSEEYSNNEIIYKENSPANFVYFIEEGTIELNSTRTILEIQLLLQEIQEKRSSMEEKDKNLEYNNIKSEWLDIEDKVDKKEIYRILILNKNNILGLESFYYQIPFLTSARVISPKAKIMKIDNEHMYQLMIRASECMHELKTKVLDKMDLITNRFFSLNNTKLMLIDNKITFDEKIKYENYLKEKNKNLMLKVSSPFKDSKIEILKKIDIKDRNKYKNKNIKKSLYQSESAQNLISNKEIEKNKNYVAKKKQLSDFFDSLIEEEEQNKKNKIRKYLNSALPKKNYDYSYDMNNFASSAVEESLLKKVKKEIKSLKENKFFFSEIPTEENEKKEDEEDELLKRERELFMKKYSERSSITQFSSSKRNSIIDIMKNKDNNKEQINEQSIFITKIDDKDNHSNNSNFNLDDNKNKTNVTNVTNKIINSKNILNNNNPKLQLAPNLPSIINPCHTKKSINNCLSIIPKNEATNKSNSIDNRIGSTKCINYNFHPFHRKLIKSYSFVNKDFMNNMQTKLDLKVFDPKEKYKIFNDNNLSKKYMLNIRKINKLKGLNEFGFPLEASKSFIPKMLHNNNDFNIKIQKYKEYRRRIERKIEEISELKY
jgi:CRP-like cAMP-binding protein